MNTRIRAPYLLFLTALRIRKAIRLYEFAFKQKVFTFPTEGEWQSAREVEGILCCVNPIVLFSQYETKLLGAYGPVVKKLVYSRLCANLIELIDHEAWGLLKNPPRI